MAFVTEYKCIGCGLELADDGRVFIWDGDLNLTKDFLILMSTYTLLHGAEISGSVSQTYCNVCDKFLMVYSIDEVQDGIANPCEVVMEGIKNNILEAGRKLGELKEIKKRAEYNVIREDGHYVVEFPEFEHSRYSYYLFPKMTRDEAVEDALKEFHEDIDYSIEWREAAYRRYLNSNYLVVDATGRSGEEHDPLEKVECPECGSEVYKYVNGEVPCPRCGNELMGVNCICYD